MSKLYKALLIVFLFLTVVITSAVTTVIISSHPAQAGPYSVNVPRELDRLRDRISFLETDVYDLQDRVSALE